MTSMFKKETNIHAGQFTDETRTSAHCLQAKALPGIDYRYGRLQLRSPEKESKDCNKPTLTPSLGKSGRFMALKRGTIDNLEDAMRERCAWLALIDSGKWVIGLRTCLEQLVMYDIAVAFALPVICWDMVSAEPISIKVATSVSRFVVFERLEDAEMGVRIRGRQEMQWRENVVLMSDAERTNRHLS